mmetsp:Transcript_31083/g.70285  ORF Transcript_31083/g.70285 Transcript_31083/m.70285 type:complete len:113 (+) Transcript_31083:885-1223(+)
MFCLENRSSSTTVPLVTGVSALSLMAEKRSDIIAFFTSPSGHSGGQNVIMPEKTLEKDALDKYLAGGRNKDSVITQVTNGKNAMPAFGGRLSEFDIEDVASYVISTSETGWR